MAKESGMGMTVTIDDVGGSGRDISNDITNLDFSTPRAIQTSTGVDKSALERILLLADYSATFNGIFNSASNKSHDVFKFWSTTSVARTTAIAISGQTLSVEALILNYALARAASGELTFSSPMVLQNGTAPTWA